MLKNYIKIAWRNLMKNKFFSLINIIGLSAGLTCCMLITVYLQYENSYDSHQTNIENLYQVGTAYVKNDEVDHKTPTTPAPIAAAMKSEFPEVAECTRLLSLFSDDKTLIQYKPTVGERKSFFEQSGYLADASFFKLFSYNFIEGNTNALNNPNTIVLSEDIAQKIFGKQSAINKVVHVNSNTNGEYDFTVTGVFRKAKAPSHIKANFFLSYTGGDLEKIVKSMGVNFAYNNVFYTYLLLKSGTNARRLEAKFPAFIKKYADNDLKGAGYYKKQFLIPVRQLHLTTEVTTNVTPPASKTYLYVLASIAVFTLLIACINFMNLSTARSSKRSAEVGIRKVLGAEKSALVRQFLGESILMSLVAFILAVGVVLLLMPVFNRVSGREITLSFIDNSGLFVGFLLMALATGIIAGSYPAFYLSSFNPVKVLKGRLSNSLAVLAIRKGLVVFQFMISVILIIASVVIARQMSYMRSADLGFTKDQQIIIPLRTANSKAIYASLKKDLTSSGQISAIGASKYYPGIYNPTSDAFYKEGQSTTDAKQTRINSIDEDFLKTLNFKLVAGRLFSPEFRADTGNSIIVNETLVNELGFPSAEKAIGQNIYADFKNKKYVKSIIGVVKDFHFQDLHSKIIPYGFKLVNDPTEFNYLIVHTKPGNVANALKQVAIAWQKNNSNEPVEYNFLDEEFQKNYAADDHLAAIVVYFTAIAIIISSLGLFGLVAFSAEQRTKEIGIRKVLGANVQTIISLLSIDFLKLIIISVIIASPIAWWVMNRWLQNFAYRQPIDWTIFTYSAVIALMVGLLTISYQATKAAVANPIKSLRSE